MLCRLQLGERSGFFLTREASAYFVVVMGYIVCRSLSSTGRYADVTSSNVKHLLSSIFQNVGRGVSQVYGFPACKSDNYKDAVLLLQIAVDRLKVRL